MIFNFFNSLLVFAAIEAHSIETYHSNFVNNHDKFDTQVIEQIIKDFYLRKKVEDPKLTEKSRRFKIRFNKPSRSF